MNIKYIIVKNEMATSETDAKYLGRAYPNGVRNRFLMTENALKTNHFAESTFDAVLDAAIAITEEYCAEGRDVDWGPIKFLTKMHGSMPYEDSAFADGDTSLAINADVTNTTRATLEALVPQKLSAAEVAESIKVSNIMDVETEAFNVVRGTKNFVVLGNGVTLDAEGEYVKAYNRKTGALEGTATVVSVSKGQRATCKFSPQLSAGEKVFEIATKGLIGETTPRIFRKNVTAVWIEPEPIAQTPDGTVKVMTFKDGDQSAVFTDGHEWVAAGQGFTEDMGAGHWSVIAIAIRQRPEDEFTIPAIRSVSTDGKKITIERDIASTVTPGEYPNARVEISLAKDGEGYTMNLPMNYVVPE